MHRTRLDWRYPDRPTLKRCVWICGGRIAASDTHCANDSYVDDGSRSHKIWGAF